ncbi:LOW QUALITY PROTEIN: Hypothetical protein PHPALM_20033 [Phytophthora palmivora]|uniref:Uncharacterized protein n=1 Tax=Phytophthora palmivora TaxID=4796 RepID=A0A2P4XFV3_9STRA|nr:LOW QUALITY PROTEIN: Hypothetical protein PHPALM_20033 [Phytophthora palmivora]
MQLLLQGLSEQGIRAVIPVGGPRITWLRKRTDFLVHIDAPSDFLQTRVRNENLNVIDDVKRSGSDARTLSYSRFTQSVRFHYPGVDLHEQLKTFVIVAFG